MSKRIVAVTVAILLAASCTKDGSRPQTQAPASPPSSRSTLPPPQPASVPANQPGSRQVLQPAPGPAPAPGPQTAVAPVPPSAIPPATTASNVPANRWSAVLVAGDNNSPAFDNGVESMREKLAQRGVQQIRVLSSNPARAAAGQIASSGNVRSALRGMSGGQACLAFVTTHGEQKGFFLRSDRRFFEPGALDSALQSGCGNSPTVVVISACHSGTFLTNEMRRPNRVILTAAARDRTSFGCGARDLYTYYDQCLLQSFDQATTFAELAANTRVCVENLERTLAIRAPSEPQTFIGAQVAGLRLPGR